MSELSFYNSLTKQVEPFTSTEPGKAYIYNCGPTVYKRQHLGNMRRFLFADFLRRTLELCGYEVREIMNITDVGHLTQDELDAGEDKLQKEARAEHTTPLAIAERETKQFFADLAILNIQEAHKYPRATDHIKEMQTLITHLLTTEHAYQTDTGIYYDVTSFPDYGKLSGNTLEQLAAGKRIAVRNEKKHPADFALWIVDPTAIQHWDSPWGVGYPGWHIECSAMSAAYLPLPIDIHTGGEDNKFPHHENEIAQSEGVTSQQFVRLWMHNAHLQLAGTKLAKRGGTQLTLDTLQEKNISPLAFRLFVFGSHYRTPLEFSWEALASAAESLAALKQLLRRVPAAAQPTTADGAAIGEFVAALGDDLNTARALAVVMKYVKSANTLAEGTLSANDAATIWATMTAFDKVLGIIAPLYQEILDEKIPADISALAHEREQARQTKDYARADQLRQQLETAGYTLEDTPTGPRIIKQ